MCYIPTGTRCTLIHIWWGDHSNSHCYGDGKMQVDPVEKAPQIEVTGV
jgi:hypothetical protein